VKTLLEARNAAVDQAAAIEATAKAASRDLTDEEVTQIQEHLDEVDRIDGEIEAAETRAQTTERLSRARATLTNAVPPRSTAAAATPIVAKEGFLADPKRGYQNPREFLLEVMEVERRIRRPSEKLLALKPSFKAAAGSDEQGEYSDPYGGWLTPPGFLPNLLRLPAEVDPISSLVTRIPMAQPSVKLAARTDKNHQTSVSGGFRVYRRAETQSVDSSRHEMEEVELNATSLMGKAFASEELLSDSVISFAAIIEQGMREEFASRLINERLWGTGVGQFLGALKSPCLVTVDKEGSQGADTILGANVLKMRKRAWRYSNCIWLANHDTYDELAGIHKPGTNSDVYLFAPGNGTDVPDTLLGRPIVFTEYAATIGDKGDLILADWSQYLEGTLEELQGAQSVHVRFESRERCFLFWTRNAGAPWWRSALTPKKSASTLSPFVVLQAR